MGILESLLNAEWVKYQVMHNTFEFWTWTIEVFLLSAALFFGIGRSFGRDRSRQRERSRRKAEQERQAAIDYAVLTQENETAWHTWALGLDPQDKLLLLYLSEHDHIDVRMGGDAIGDHTYETRQLIDANSIGNNTWRLRMNDDGRAIVRRFGAILGEVSEDNCPFCWWRPYGDDAS